MAIETERYDLFATRVWVMRPEQLEPHFPAWIAAIEEWRAADRSQGSSNRNGWTSAKTLFGRSEFAPLESAARQCLAAAYGETDLIGKPDFTMQAWVNLQEPGGFNHFHSHGEAGLSGVFYLKVPAGSGDLVLRDPRAGINLIGLRGNGVNCHSVTTHTPSAGEFVIFPGWLEHAVEVNQAQEARIAVAINSFPARGG